ncbi:unnamed protein product [Cochlearia groenlandica]
MWKKKVMSSISSTLSKKKKNLVKPPFAATEAATQASSESPGATNSGQSTILPSPELVNLTYLKLVPPKKGYIYGIGSSQYLDVDRTEPAPVSLACNLEVETRVRSLESDFKTMKSSVDTMSTGMESVIAMQKLILQNLGFDPATMEPSPNAAASNNTPVGSVKNYQTQSDDAIHIPDDEEEKDEEEEQENEGEEQEQEKEEEERVDEA